MRVRYRLHQLWLNLTAGPLPDTAWQEITALLSPEELALFKRYTPADQWHSYRVLRTLRERDVKDRIVLVAALLHDVGKTTCKLSMWDRTLAVIVERIWPSRAAEWGAGEATGWRRPFAVRQQHAVWGANMAKKAGSRPEVVVLIAHHQTPNMALLTEDEKTWLAQLRAADEEN